MANGERMGTVIDIFVKLVDFIVHVDVHIGDMIAMFGIFTYVILFFVIFAETGFVFTPILPGDSLLFAVGAFAALGSFNIVVMLVLLSSAAILGDTANYWIGHFFGDRILQNKRFPVKQEYIDETHMFFKKHGGKTIILARFAPIIRTFAPFVAGIGQMHYARFLTFNVVGGAVWVCLFTLAGFFFGNVPVIKQNFSLVIMSIVAVSLVPMVVGALKDRGKKAPAA